MAWFRNLNAPRWSLPMPGFIAVGAAYYGTLGYVLARALDRRDNKSTGLAVTILVGNEAWNALLFGRRNTREAFIGLLVFLAPLVALQRSVWADPRARWTLLPYTAYVILYDAPWSYRLWRLNKSSPLAPVLVA